MGLGTALVTGATGGLGRQLVVDLLASGRTVVATGRNAAIGAQHSALGARFIAADLVEDDLRPLVAGMESVFHTAALSSPWGRRDAFVSANQIATTRLIDASRDARVRRFVFVSTPSIYTAPIHQLGLSEDSPLPEPFANAYAATKFAAECTVLAENSPHLETVVLRPRAIIGPRDTVLLPRLLRAAHRGRMPLPGHGEALIELTDVRDVSSALLAAEAAPARAMGQAYNISGGVPLPLKDIVTRVFARLGKDAKLTPLSNRLVLQLAGLAEAVARVIPGQPEPPITRYSAMALGWSQTFDLSKAREHLNWQPQYHPLESIDRALGHA